MNRDELQYAIALYFGRGNAEPPEPSEPKDWEPNYPNSWSGVSNSERRRPIDPISGRGFDPWR